MGKETVKERAAVSRERRLALALRGLIDAVEDGTTDDAVAEAQQLLSDFGLSDLVGIPRQLKVLNERLGAAVAAQDYATVASLGAEMDKIKAGKFHKAAVTE